MLPLLLILLATLASGVVAFGTHPNWVVWARRGMDFIVFARRAQWPLTFLAVGLCVGLIGMVVVGRRRVFWLLGLAPVAGLLFYHFSGDPMNGFRVRENPAFVSAQQAAVGDDDYVVGLKFGDEVYAYPYAALYGDPVVSQLERGKRLLLIWNAFANKATAYQVDHDVPGRDLEIVSMPANAVVVYNARLGEFINGITGRRPNGEKVSGFLSPVETTKTTWKSWRDAHPGTKVMVPLGRYAIEGLPKRAVLPYYKVPAVAGELAAEARVVAIGRDSSVAIPVDRVKEGLTQLTVDGVPVVLFRDPQTGVVRAFDRRIDEGVTADFQLNADARRKNVALVDRTTNTGWSWGGSAVDGAAKWKGRKLEAVPVEEDLYYGVAKYWHPSMTVAP